ncbi:MAG: type II toxin-antitoxin system PemK/MazF family toxin [Paracoccaceae bacterium]|jgi:uncharacterized protein YifN (PemK superfamily)
MAIQYHPARGSIVTVDFSQGFRVPEMVKRRLCVVISPPIEARVGLCTVVPLSTTAPDPVQAYHYCFEIPFHMPKAWGNQARWAKCDMVCAVGLHRVDLIRLGKTSNGTRIYQMNTLSRLHLRNISNCVLAGLGLPPLTE